MRAAGFLPINTLTLPITMLSGGPTQTAIEPTVAAGIPPINTVGTPGGRMGPPTWGIGGSPGANIGQTCMSETRAAGCDITLSPDYSTVPADAWCLPRGCQCCGLPASVIRSGASLR